MQLSRGEYTVKHCVCVIEIQTQVGTLKIYMFGHSADQNRPAYTPSANGKHLPDCQGNTHEHNARIV